MLRLPKQIYLLMGAAIVLGILLRQINRQVPNAEEAIVDAELIQGIPSIPNVAGWPQPFLDELQKAHLEFQDSERDLRIEALANLGELYLANGFNGEAEVCFAALVKLGLGEARWTYFLGVATRDYGDKRVAIDAFERVRRARGDYLNTRYELGSVYVESGHILDSVQHFEFLLGMPEWEAWARYGLARGLALEERFGQALQELNRAIVADSEVRDFFALLEEISLAGGLDSDSDTDTVIDIEDTVEKRPYDPWFQSLWLRCFDPILLIRFAHAEAIHGRLDQANVVLDRAMTLTQGELPETEARLELRRILSR